MKVAVIVTEFPSVSETFVTNEITGLLARGHDVHVFAWQRGRSPVVHPDVLEHRLLERTRYLAVPELWRRPWSALRLLAAGLPHGPGPLLRSLDVTRFGREAVSLSLLHVASSFDAHYDVIHCQFGTNGDLGAKLKALGISRKLVVTFHGYDLRRGLAGPPGLYARVFAASDRVIAISGYNHETLVRLGAPPEKLVIHPVGIDVRRFAGRPLVRPGSQDEVRIVTVARLSEEKGLDHGIRAVAALRDRRPQTPVRYRIVGGGRSEAQLRELVRSLGLEETVEFLGPRPHDEVATVLAESDLFMLPSLAEALPVVLMEAQASGLPTLATAVGSVDEIVLDGRTGFVVPPGDTAALAERLGHLLEHRDRWAELGSAGRRHVAERFDIEMLNDRLVDLYRSL